MQSGFDPHTSFDGATFHDPPSSIPATTKASVNKRVSKQVTSISILTSHEPRTTTSHIWSSDMN